MAGNGLMKATNSCEENKEKTPKNLASQTNFVICFGRQSSMVLGCKRSQKASNGRSAQPEE